MLPPLGTLSNCPGLSPFSFWSPELPGDAQVYRIPSSVVTRHRKVHPLYSADA